MKRILLAFIVGSLVIITGCQKKAKNSLCEKCSKQQQKLQHTQLSRYQQRQVFRQRCLRTRRDQYQKKQQKQQQVQRTENPPQSEQDCL